jgi:hypothetical protein
VEGPDTDLVLDTFPNGLYVTQPGVYTLSQTPVSGEYVVENIYVKIPAGESDIHAVQDELANPFVEQVVELQDQDMLYWFALILIVLLFCEWLLQLKEYF